MSKEKGRLGWSPLFFTLTYIGVVGAICPRISYLPFLCSATAFSTRSRNVGCPITWSS